ncbi:metalloproteinase inhibitor 3-like isoform X2 [Saccostrea cucullata]|uniref:metalloproteinase inhibitor 3-like isoform X2 n=1 Tax=Saccostrea cuccullata TaxID=36930 RepID=UPI002ED18505
MRNLILFAVFLAFILQLESCKCLSKHPQRHFCNSNFVVHAKVISRSQRIVNNGLNVRVAYTVQILQDFKLDDRRFRQQPPIRIIKSSSSFAACGSYFELNKEYVISGSNIRGEWETNLCAWNDEVDLLTQYQRNALDLGVYKNSCNCQVLECAPDVMNCPAAGRNECVIRSNFNCHYGINTCRRVNSMCMWTSPCNL